MKKYVLWTLFALISGALLGKITFDKYEKIDVKNTIKIDTNVYALKYKTYLSVEEMKDDITNIDRYIYIQKDDKVTAYVAISKDKENINKINDIYNVKNIFLTKEIININNDEFIQNLSEYEKLLSVAEDEKSLLIIENQILSCYEKLVVENE